MAKKIEAYQSISGDVYDTKKEAEVDDIASYFHDNGDRCIQMSSIHFIWENREKLIKMLQQFGE